MLCFLWEQLIVIGGKPAKGFSVQSIDSDLYFKVQNSPGLFFSSTARGKWVCRSKNRFGYKAQWVQRSEIHSDIKYSRLLRRRDHLRFFGLRKTIWAKILHLGPSSADFGSEIFEVVVIWRRRICENHMGV